MTNHFHLVAIPDTDDGTSAMMQALTSEYARILNLRHDLRGHLWQSRFNSCVMDESHVGFTMAYVERNPVRAGMTEHPTDYAWSSAGVHTGATRAPAWLDTRPFDQRFTHRDWASILSESRDDRNQLAAVRSATRNNEPLGSPDFVQTLEFVHSRRLLRRPPGRPSKPQLQAAG